MNLPTWLTEVDVFLMALEFVLLWFTGSSAVDLSRLYAMLAVALLTFDQFSSFTSFWNVLLCMSADVIAFEEFSLFTFYCDFFYFNRL